MLMITSTHSYVVRDVRSWYNDRKKGLKEMGHHSPWRVELRSVSEILMRYCQALTAMEVQIRSTVSGG